MLRMIVRLYWIVNVLGLNDNWYIDYCRKRFIEQIVKCWHEDEPLTEILTEISGKSGLNGSNSVEIGSVKTEPRNRLEPASVQGLVPRRVIETLVEVAGIEPASRNLSDSASTYVVLLLI